MADREREYPHWQGRLGHFDGDWFAKCERRVVSPGVAISEPAVQAARRAGSEVIGDIELFARKACAPVVAINVPAGGETLAGTQTLQWTIDDALSSSHTSAVQYCPVGEAELRLRSRRRR